jgi:hypothetical protein
VAQDRVEVSERDAGWLAKLVFRAIRGRLGRVPKAKVLAAYHTPALLASSWMDAACAPARTVSAALKELAQLKVAAMVGCPF